MTRWRKWNIQIEPSQYILWYLLCGIMYLGGIPIMVYVRTWSRKFNNVQFLVSDMYNGNGRSIT